MTLTGTFARETTRGSCREAPSSRAPWRPLLRHCLLQVLVALVEEAGGGEPLLVGADQECEVLGHVSGFDGVDRDPLQRLGEPRQLLVAVELGAMRQATGPGEDRGDRVGRRLATFL